MRRRGACQESICFTQGEVYEQLIYIQLIRTMERVKPRVARKSRLTRNISGIIGNITGTGTSDKKGTKTAQQKIQPVTEQSH